jgi:two-component system OmpR family sensor kinase
MTTVPAAGPRRRRRPLRARVVLSVLAITIVAFAAFDYVAVTQLRHYLLNRTDATLQQVLDLATPRLNDLLARVDKGQPPQFLQHDLGLLYVGYVPAHGSAVTLETSPGLSPQLPANLTSIAADHRSVTVINTNGTSWLRLRAAPVPAGTFVVSSDLHELNQTVAQLRRIVGFGSIAAIAVIAVGLLYLLRRGLRPMEAMAAQADRISAGDLTDRVHPDDPVTEVGRLGAAINGMLARIDTDVRQREHDQELTRQFLADASHELRTPLASLRANAELYQQGALTATGDVEEAMRRISLEAARMSRLVDDMLRLARLDQHPEIHRRPVDLTALLTRCADRARIAQPDRGWTIAIDPALACVGGDELLERAVDNLIANVHIHTPAATPASLRAARTGDTIHVDVSDAGPGVPADQLPHLFDRFYRANGHGATGSGLGLAIVREIANAHGGTTEAATGSSGGGLTVTLTLPATDTTAASEQIIEDVPMTLPPPPATRSPSPPKEATT